MAWTSVLEERLSSSGAARAWLESTEALATQLVATMDSRDAVTALFDALHGALGRTLAKVATGWNNAHDRSRALPLEIQELCLSPLALSQKCQLLRVSAHWRATTARMPALWTEIDLRWVRRNVDLGALLARSGRLPFDLQLSVEGHTGLQSLSACLLPHAHRMRRLAVLGAYGPISELFPYPAPVLEQLTLELDDEIPSLMFYGSAPKLRSVHFDEVSLPAVCPALAGVTSATLEFYAGGLSKVFSIMPALQDLDLLWPGDEAPQIPGNVSLRAFKLHDDELWLSREQLRQITSRATLVTISASYDSRKLADALAHGAGAAGPSLELMARSALKLEHELELTFQSNPGCALLFVFSDVRDLDVQQLLCSATLTGIARLVLPRTFRLSMMMDGATDLPGVRTLAIRCGQSEDSWDMPRLGSLRVPALARVELLGAQTSALVNIEALVSFITDVLELADRASLEVFVDTASGIRLEGDVGRLRACVGRVFM